MLNKVHIILLPEPKTLLNININLDFLKKYIFYKSHIANTYTNLLEQCVKIDHLYVYTTYGFQESRKCKIIKEESNFQSKFLKAIFIDFPLEGNYNIKLKNVDIHIDTDEDNNENNQHALTYTDGKITDTENNQTSNEFFESEILNFLYYFIIVPGYENFIGKKIVHIATQTLKMMKNNNEHVDNNTQDVLTKRAYSLLHPCIWNHLTKNYKKIEKKMQKKMKYLKNNSSSFLRKSNLDNLKPIQIQNIALRICQIEMCDNPIDKMLILHQISKMMCELITYNTENCKHDEMKNINVFEIDSDTLMIVLSVIIAYSKIKNIISHAIHLHMYIDNLAIEKKIDNLSFIFTIFHSSIIYICDVENI